MVTPSSIEVNTNLLPVWIEQIQTDTVAFSPENATEPGLVLPVGQRRLQIAFNAPCLRAAHRVRFKHKLEPIEAGWIDSDNNREVTYAQVPPGDYRFRVIACNEDGVWNETGTSVAITIPPFLWERAWFIPACWAVGLGTLVGAVLILLRQRIKRQIELLKQQHLVERERTRIAKDLHDDLGGSLTEINMLADTLTGMGRAGEASPEAARQIIQKSNRLVRALDEIVWAVNPKHDSLRSLADYLAGYAQEFFGAAGVRFRQDIQRVLPEIPLTPEQRHDIFLAAKEALTNVVRHSGASEARLGLKVLEGPRLLIVVEDKGCGFDPATSSPDGDGLVNMRERLTAMGGACRITSRIGAGTMVELELPLK